MRDVKIVCTLGPATDGRAAELVQSGMDVARLNFSHGAPEEHRRRYEEVRAAAKDAGRPVGILADLSGPKIRVGAMKGGAMPLAEGARVVLTPEPVVGEAGRIPHNYAPLARDVKPGGRILLDDGLLALVVEDVRGEEVVCRVATGGVLRDHKGMNLPGAALSTPALTAKDRADLAFARELGVDWFALSFVRRPEDIAEAKLLAGDVPVLAKIEKPEAVERLDAILDAADGAMVARGDLGVEAGYEKVPALQKRIVAACRLRGRPVITATQMLNSMIESPTPTRAEVSDVANAVLDGTDAVMLSGETAVGRYPLEAVRVMASIVEEVESSGLAGECSPHPDIEEPTFSNAIAGAATDVAAGLGVAAIAVYTESGRSAGLVAAHRPKARLAAFSRHERVLQRLALWWGVRPFFGEWVNDPARAIDQAERALLAAKLVQPGDAIAVTYGLVLGGEAFQTSMLHLWRVRG